MISIQLLKYLLISSFLLIGGCNQPESKPAVFNVPKPVTAVQLIIPGKSIGKITLNENAELVFKKLGKPDAGDAAMGKSVATWYANHDSASYQTQIFCSRQMGTAHENTNSIKQIRITSPYFKTVNGIGAGSMLKQINAFFIVKKTLTYKENKQQFFVYDTIKGIAFEVAANGKCVGIIVYLPENAGNITYLPFRSVQQILSK
ncbi:MAG: hypothetical protein EOP42_28930 [Sphingobacteriaceae bacterium]|nr:MAG: hypothetical protein EOP42_28930 [Sphingobacteriaceae bacterium]